MNRRRIIFFSIIISLCMVFSSTSYAAVSRSPRLSVKTLHIEKDRTYKLHIYNTRPEYTTEFTTSNSDVVMVRKNKVKSCRLKACSIGSATVTAKVFDGEGNEITALKCRVVVSPPALSVKFTKKKVKLTVGRSRIIKAVVKPNISYEQPKYTSDDTSIVTISSTGVVTAVSKGQTTIRATISNGTTASCVINVVDKKSPATPSLSPQPSDGYNFSESETYKPSPKTTGVPSYTYSAKRAAE